MQNSAGVHFQHCCQDDYQGVCKYGDDDCPAVSAQPIGIRDADRPEIDRVVAALIRHSQSAFDDRAQAVHLIEALVREVDLAAAVVTSLRRD